MTSIPNPAERPIGPDGCFSLPWRRFLAALAQSSDTAVASAITQIATALGSPDGTVANIPQGTDASISLVGQQGVRVYGSGGRYTIRLTPLEDTAVGTAIYKFTRDDFGRVEGTEAATTDDLTEGATNLYHTAQRVRDTVLTGLLTATNAVIAATDSVLTALGKLQAQVSAIASSFVASTRTISTTAPLTGGGDLSANRTLAISAATTGAAGSMSAADKAKLDGIATGATAYTDSAAQAAVVIDSIADADTTHAPSRNAVFDALALKGALASTQTWTGANTFQSSNTAFYSVSDSDGPGNSVRRQRATGTGALASGDRIGFYNFQGYNGSGFPIAASIESYTLEAFTGAGNGAKLAFFTCAVGATTRVRRWEVDETALYPFADNAYNIGSATKRATNGYMANLRPGAGTVIWTSGSGTPEGSIVAPIGSLFTRTDGGAGTTLYVKESGAGNTGWVAK